VVGLAPRRPCRSPRRGLRVFARGFADSCASRLSRGVTSTAEVESEMSARTWSRGLEERSRRAREWVESRGRPSRPRSGSTTASSGSGGVTLGKDGRLKATFRIEDGDSSTFTAVRPDEPNEPIPPPPSYRDRWRRRW